MRHRTFTLTVAALTTVLVVTGCGNNDETASTILTAPPPTAASTTTTSLSATTSSAPTSTLSTTTTAAQSTTTAIDSSTTSTTEGVALPDTVIAVSDVDLVEIDLGDGTVTRTLSPLFSEGGVFRGGLRITPDRSTIFFSEGYEDSWYSCESSRGSVGQVAFDGGELERVTPGANPTPSPDGRYLAYVDSTLCIPDPENPELWVFTPFNVVVVRHLESGESTTHSIEATPQTPYEPSALHSVAWHPDGDLLALAYSGAIYQFPVGTSDPIDRHPTLPFDLDTESYPGGIDVAGDRLVAVGYTEDFSEATATTFDLATGARIDLLTTSDHLSIGVNAAGQIILATSPADDFEAPATLVTESGERIELDVPVVALDW